MTGSEAKKQRSVSLIIFLCCSVLYVLCFSAAYVLACRQAPVRYAMFIAFAAFITCGLGVAGITTALLSDRKKKITRGAYFTGLFGNILIVLLFLAMCVYSFMQKPH
jgi:hypothetical protein